MDDAPPLVPRKAQLVGMELLRTSLSDKVELMARRSGGRPLEDRLLIAWGSDVAEGLLHLLRHGVVHRDLKLDNVMWDPAEGRDGMADDVGRVVIIDLGCALWMGTGTPRARSPVSEQLQRVAATLDAITYDELQQDGLGIGGNMPHLAPEVLDGWNLGTINKSETVHVPYGKQASWALGVLLWELATGGEHPFGEDYPGHTPGESKVAAGKLAKALGLYLAGGGTYEGQSEMLKRPAWFQ